VALIILYQQNSGWVPLIGLMDMSLDPPAYVNDASEITATLFDQNGNPVPELTDVAGVYVEGSNGNYNFPVPAEFNPPAGGGYVLVVDATAPSGAIAHSEVPAIVGVRES
jgi:hypothetical protein